ncbi:uracil-DNA glycosylase [Asaia sp. BMEF1]|uniref:uracil-DNA glycosylase n=1 Tax=Asaia sp. BMEF1 TaxID=3155932 RepID=UPI003F66A409
MSLSLSGQDHSEILALLDLYRDWGVDCALDDVAPHRLDRAASLSLPQAMRQRPARPPAARQNVTPPVQPRPSLVDTQAAQAWGVETFPECALARTASTSVRPRFVPGATLMLVGDAPDADEDRSGEVFAGETGRLLDMILPSIGLDRSRLSQAPALPWRPPGGRAVSQIESRECRALLNAAIVKARPERLILLGLTPLRLLLDEQASMARSRGAWHRLRLDDGSAVEALAMQHPQQLLSSARARREMWKDLVFLAETLASS